ncbi:MAG: hypothetical protein U0527_14535 [Candidatus Eisenbacteria bacterium]
MTMTRRSLACCLGLFLVICSIGVALGDLTARTSPISRLTSPARRRAVPRTSSSSCSAPFWWIYRRPVGQQRMSVLDGRLPSRSTSARPRLRPGRARLEIRRSPAGKRIVRDAYVFFAGKRSPHRLHLKTRGVDGYLLDALMQQPGGRLAVDAAGNVIGTTTPSFRCCT